LCDVGEAEALILDDIAVLDDGRRQPRNPGLLAQRSEVALEQLNGQGNGHALRYGLLPKEERCQ
jgi:hypothetical protein